jgi:hypothetical protein
MTFSFFYTYYGQRHMVPLIQAQGLRCTIIDDGTPEPLGPVQGCDVWRIEEDIEWNIPGAKNLGFHVLDGWILHLPIDHILTPDVHAQIDAMPKERGVVYCFASIYEGVVEYVSPHDMILVHKEDFEAIGGFDEDFAGHYGYEDGLFWQMCCNRLKAVEHFDIRVPWLPAGKTTNDRRNSSRNLAIFNAKDKFHMNTPRLRFRYHREGNGNESTAYLPHDEVVQP